MSFEPVLAFPTDDVNFVLGFEAGRVWRSLEGSPDEPLDFTVHTANAEIILRMAEKLEREWHWEELDDTWAQAFFAPASTRSSD